jgi:hypothetical protein
MSESFIQSFILDHLGGELKMTLETHVEKLVEWNMITRARGCTRPSPQDVKELSASENLGRKPRIDLVIFADRPKDQWDILALVEIKSGWIAGGGPQIPEHKDDRAKLLRVLQYLDTCRYGIVCGWAPERHRRWVEEQAKYEYWHDESFEINGASYFFGARVFQCNALS